MGSVFQRLIEIMDRLREECPWDKEQTMDSLRHLTIEETFELADAIAKKEMPEIKKELGDLLLHIVFYARIATEQKAFTIQDVIEGLCEKLIFRHPHVFGDTEVEGTQQVVENWEALKLKEKGGNKRLLDGVPKALPSLTKSYRIQQKMKGVGFDWKEPSELWDKVKEEVEELNEALSEKKQEAIEEEFGDLFFMLTNVARHYGIDPDLALDKTNEKVIRRFNYMEEKAISRQRPVKEMTLEEQETLWQEAKRNQLK